ncbi:MAG: hypothetical protein U0802_03105 [Candidatus Binatia bacterium]
MLAAPGALRGLTSTPTATRTPCDTGGAQLELQLTADPAQPVVGDVVDLTLAVRNPSGALAGLPTYSLSGAAPIFATELVERAYPYAGDARYRLTALQPGRATLVASVYYETSHRCFGGPTFFFRSSASDPLVVDVSGPNGGTPTAAPTVTPTPTSNRPPPVAVIDAMPNPAAAGARVDLDSQRSHGAVNGRYWKQVGGPAVELHDCIPLELGCAGMSTWFVAPAVTADTILRFSLLLTSYGSTPWDSGEAEVAIVPPATAGPTFTPSQATATPFICAGDCSGDGAVGVDDLVRGVSIALGSQPTSTCPAMDHDGDGAVSIDEIVLALARALDGCPR